MYSSAFKPLLSACWWRHKCLWHIETAKWEHHLGSSRLHHPISRLDTMLAPSHGAGAVDRYTTTTTTTKTTGQSGWEKSSRTWKPAWPGLARDLVPDHLMCHGRPHAKWTRQAAAVFPQQVPRRAEDCFVRRHARGKGRASINTSTAQQRQRSRKAWFYLLGVAGGPR